MIQSSDNNQSGSPEQPPAEANSPIQPVSSLASNSEPDLNSGSEPNLDSGNSVAMDTPEMDNVAVNDPPAMDAGGGDAAPVAATV